MSRWPLQDDWDKFSETYDESKLKQHTEESSMVGKLGPLTDEHKEAISRANRGRKPTPKQLEKLSKAMSGKKRPFTKAHKESISARRIGMTFSKEHKEKMSEAAKKRWELFRLNNSAGKQ